MNLRQAAKMALDVLERLYDNGEVNVSRSFHEEVMDELAKVLAEHDRLEGIAVIEKDARIHVSQQTEPEQEPVARLKRGTTGRCTRRVCECEKEGLGLECIWLEPMIDGYPLWSGIPTAKQQEPVARQINDGTSTYVTDRRVDAEEAAAEGWVRTPLYTAPTPRQWVGLTEEDFSAINQSCLTKLQAATSAESILKEKNT